MCIQKGNRVQDNFWDTAEYITETGCLIWMRGDNAQGYGRVCFDGRQYHAHRIAWSLINGPIEIGKYILHHCDTPACINPRHLFIGTHADNSRDMVKKGRGAGTKGVSHNKAVLTDSQILEIRGSDVKNVVLCKKYNVHHSTIARVRRGDTWSHVRGEHGAT